MSHFPIIHTVTTWGAEDFAPWSDVKSVSGKHTCSSLTLATSTLFFLPRRPLTGRFKFAGLAISDRFSYSWFLFGSTFTMDITSSSCLQFTFTIPYLSFGVCVVSSLFLAATKVWLWNPCSFEPIIFTLWFFFRCDFFRARQDDSFTTFILSNHAIKKKFSISFRWHVSAISLYSLWYQF